MAEPFQTARYLQISRDISQRIISGAYVPGSQLPTENELGQHFGVNRHTVRDALKELKKDGLVYSIRGKGNFVSEYKVIYQLSDKVQFSRNILAANLNPGSILLDAERVVDGDLAAKLELASDAPLLRLNILRKINELPFSLSTSYLPQARFPDLPDHLLGSFSLYAVLKDHYQIEPQRRQSLIETRLPDVEEMHRLHISPRQPLLVISSLACDREVLPVEYVITRARGDLGCLSIDFDQLNARSDEDY